MKKIIVTTIIIICLFFGTGLLAYADSGNELQSQLQAQVWRNKRGSTLTIDKINNNGFLTGTYINRAKGFKCQNISYPVTGWVYDKAITFTTKWESEEESCFSITSWTGSFSTSDNQIQTLWQLVLTNGTIQAGFDIFSPLN